jgi:hypothetical protein
MILRTDALLGGEAIAAPGPLALLIDFPKPASTGPASRRVVSVQVNGTGEIMLWHVTENGVVDRIDLPGGAQHILTDETTVKNEFDNVDELTQTQGD